MSIPESLMQVINNNKTDCMNFTINMAQNNNYRNLQQGVIDVRNFLMDDNKSTVDIFGNEHFLTKIRSENVNMTIITNARNIIVKLIFPTRFGNIQYQ